MKHLLRYIFIFLFCFFALSSARAATSDSITVSGQVFDAFTREPLDSVRIEVEVKEGVAEPAGPFITFDLVADARQKYGMNIYTCPPYIGYRFMVPTSGTYALTLSRRGYATQKVEVKVPARQYGRKTREWKPKDILLQRFRERALDEAVVQATKVMMVHRGDTVVFNADYFELSQGSMLDELISRMPGLEIKSGGQIFYNGNRLSSLLVNGKDFFSGDPAIALQNLPAYTVKEVKVFHKANASERFAKYRKDEHEDPNTLDVVLKKEYSHGWITNYTLAGGLPLERKPWNDVKYLARLFALHYGNRSRLGLFGNFNNVNDASSADQDGGWHGGASNQGRQRTTCGGLLYSIDSKNKKVWYSLDFQAKHQTNEEERQTSSTTFLNTSDVFRRSTSLSSQSSTHLSASNALHWEGKDAELELHANGSYTNEDNNSHSLSAQFSADPKDAYRGASLDSIFVGPSSPRLARLLTNRLAQSTLLHRRSWEQTTSAILSFRDPLLGNNGELRLGYEYNGQSSEQYELYDLRYNADSSSDNDFRNRYTRTPYGNFHFASDFNYRFNNMLSEATAGWLSLGISYSADIKRKSGDRQLYNLHTLAESATLPLGTLPSMANWQASTLSAPDSYESRGLNVSNMLAPDLGIGSATNKFGKFNITPWVDFLHNRYDDTRSTAKADQTYTFFSPSVYWQRSILTESEGVMDRMHIIRLHYNLQNSAPEASMLLGIRDAYDPLSVSLGNASLRPSTTHHASADWLYTRDSRDCEFNVIASYSRTQKAVAMGYTYNNITGVYTHQPQNVDGNWEASFNMRFSRPLDKKRLLHFYTTLQ
ncbi:MAG: outer membrane beta-barrel family protein, partial [Bacteroidaceae bacterium]|nr:outer membrane beta-barrel family protein [Bacteroidaceae bacterium]